MNTEPVIAVSELTYTYPKTTEPAVRGMDFTVAPGEIFGFLGPSGAGKSTMFRLLLRLQFQPKGKKRTSSPALQPFFFLEK